MYVKLPITLSSDCHYFEIRLLISCTGTSPVRRTIANLFLRINLYSHYLTKVYLRRQSKCERVVHFQSEISSITILPMILRMQNRLLYFGYGTTYIFADLLDKSYCRLINNWLPINFIELLACYCARQYLVI